MTDEAAKEPASGASDQAVPSAGMLRHLLDSFLQARIYHEDKERQAAAERQLEEMRALLEHHVTDPRWRRLLHHALEAAQQGAHETLLLRFPSTQCADGGRAINVQDATWPDTLTGAAADVYRMYQAQLHRQGFRLTARILDYPQGNLGDVGLFLSWASDK